MRLTISLTVLFLIVAPSSRPLCPFSPQLICGEYFNRKAIVEAKLIRTRHIVPKHEQDGFIYTLETGKVFRGHLAATFEVYEENSSGRASFEWGRSESYHLFLNPERNGTRWWMDGCGNSVPLRQAAKTLRIIESFKTKLRSGGFIQGKIVGSGLAMGIRIEIHGSDHVYQTRTDQNDEFRIRVPPATIERQLWMQVGGSSQTS